jgi:hypothetical protein
LVSYIRDALLYGVDYILQPTAFIRREAWRTVGPLEERLRYCMDYDFWFRLSERFEVGTIPHVVAAGAPRQQDSRGRRRALVRDLSVMRREGEWATSCAGFAGLTTRRSDRFELVA